MTKLINLHFDGSWDPRLFWSSPYHGGVYCVWSTSRDPRANQSFYRRLIYTGQSEDIPTRILRHDGKKEWHPHMEPGEQLWFTAAAVLPFDVDRAEAALIHQHRPPANVQHLFTFPFESTRIVSTGHTGLLSVDFTVEGCAYGGAYLTGLRGNVSPLLAALQGYGGYGQR
jgi:hypothetical protein